MNKSFILFICILILCACSEDEYIPTLNELVDINIMFSPNGLGDRGYNDNILSGIFLAAKKRGFTPRVICPQDNEEAKVIFSTWIENNIYKRSLFILATNEYRSLAQTYFKTNNNPEKTVLLFETDDTSTAAYTFNISLYGASYFAGSITATLPHNESAILCANPEDPVLEAGAKGFENGFSANGGVISHRFYITNDAKGYDMPDAAYEIAHDLAEDYAFIYPLAGGSNAGVYHYSRENKGLYTAGMDKDCSSLSPNIIYSVIKKTDRVLEQYVTDWIDKINWKKHQNFGLQSEHIELVLSKDYKDTFIETYNSWKSKAIEAENEYEAIH